jgi:hypothetical protein
MKWQPAPLIKLYEALGAIADDRIHISGNTAKVYSSSGNKYYTVIYDSSANAITSNDNASYWVGYLGYPSIAMLLVKGVVKYDKALAVNLKNISWKDINVMYNNDFDKTQAFIDAKLATEHAVDIKVFHKKLYEILKAVNALKLNKLKSAQMPPDAY